MQSARALTPSTRPRNPLPLEDVNEKDAVRDDGDDAERGDERARELSRVVEARETSRRRAIRGIDRRGGGRAITPGDSFAARSFKLRCAERCLIPH